jgi:quercetin dioxygenase-like cupin family protein
MVENYTYIEDVLELIDSFPPESILSRTIYQDQHIKTVLFGFQPGQELSEHTASVPAVVHFLKGRAEVVLGEEHHQAGTGSWIHMPPNLPHSIHAEEETLMLLTLIQEKA